jgi:hypothetical protein
MCGLALVRYRALLTQLPKPIDGALEYENVLTRVEHASIEVVVFAGMCLEATLFDLAACLYGDEFSESIDKLDPVSKFFVIAQLVDRTAPDRSSVTVQSIQSVVQSRNRLVHHKSHSAENLDTEIGKLMERARREHDQHLRGVEASFKSLVLLSLHFDGNIFEELRILPSFKKPDFWQQVVPVALHEEVRWCIEVSRKKTIGDRPRFPFFRR